MRHSRVTAAILAPWLGLLLSFAPASAHPGSTVYEIGVGVTTPIVVLVPADYGKPIDGIEITDAPGFRLDSGLGPDGWRVSRTGDTLDFSGGYIPANDSRLFTIRGAARVKGVLIFPVTTHSPDGTLMHYWGGRLARNAGAVVDAGGASPPSGGGRFPWKTVSGGVVVGVGVLGTTLLVGRRRRAGQA